MNDLVTPWNQYILTFSFVPLLSCEKSTFHTILTKFETIIKRNKKKQLENPFRKSSNSQLWTKYWSRLTFLINISLHSSKAWGRLTLIETNLDHSDFSFFFGPLFSCTRIFVSINMSHSGSMTTFSHQTKRNSPKGCSFNRERWKVTEFPLTF